MFKVTFPCCGFTPKGFFQTLPVPAEPGLGSSLPSGSGRFALLPNPFDCSFTSPDIYGLEQFVLFLHLMLLLPFAGTDDRGSPGR